MLLDSVLLAKKGKRVVLEMTKTTDEGRGRDYAVDTACFGILTS